MDYYSAIDLHSNNSFVDVIDESFDSKLVRLTGVIAKINGNTQSL